MKKILNLVLVCLMAVTLSACGGADVDHEEAMTSEMVGKTIALTSSILILDLNKENQISKSPSAHAQGMALSLETLSNCTGCNYYQGGTFRQLISPGAQISIKSAYTSVPSSSSINKTAVNYFMAEDADGAKFVLPEYEMANVTGFKEDRAQPEAALLERLLGEYDDPAVQKPFILKVQPNWLKHGHPELVPPYKSEAVAAYFNALIAGMKPDSFSGLQIHPEEFFITLKTGKVGLANIILYSEGLKFDIIPASGSQGFETPVMPTP